MEKKVHFSNILTYMEKKTNFVLMLSVRVKLLSQLFPIEQLFFALNVKNNKVDPFKLPIYTTQICQIQNQLSDVLEE